MIKYFLKNHSSLRNEAIILIISVFIILTFSVTSAKAATGNLKIVINTLGGDETFRYAYGITNNSPYSIVGLITTSGGTGSSGLITVNSGTYTITQTVSTSDWILTSSVCDNSYSTTVDGVASVTVSPDQTTTCTFSNYNTTGTITNNPVPIITNINPSSKTVGDAAFTLTINGTNFIPTSTINIQGLSATTTYVSPTQLTTFVSPTPSVGTYNITVVSPLPGGGTSNAMTFTVKSNQGELIIVKNTTGGDGIFNYTVTGPTSSTPSITTVNGNGFSNATVNQGTYSVTETVPNGWTFNSAVCGQLYTEHVVVLTAADTSPWTVPADWNNSSNSIEAIGGGGGGGTGGNATADEFGGGGGGGGGGAYAKATNLTLSGTVTFIIGAAGTGGASPTNGGQTQFKDSSTVKADKGLKGAVGGIGSGGAGGAGGTVANSVGAATRIAGGNGGSGNTGGAGGNGAAGWMSGNYGAGGGGGAGGNVPTGVGSVGKNGTAGAIIITYATIINAGTSITNGASNITVSPGQTATCAFSNTKNNPVPTIINIAPQSATAGSPSLTLTVNGTNFISSSVVKWNGLAKTTTYVSATQLTAVIPSTDLTIAGTYNITVVSPSPGGGTSNAVSFTINVAPNPVPTITSISPISKTVGDADFTLTVNGTNFISTSTINIQGLSATTTYVSPTQLTTFVSPTPSVGTYNITVVSPLPGGGTSNAKIVTINAAPNPIPTITSITPSSATVGSPEFTLTVNGTNFVSSSIIRWNGSNRTTAYVSPIELTATILTSDLTAIGSKNITVFNPTPGGGTSNSIPFTVTIIPLGTLKIIKSTVGGDGVFNYTIVGPTAWNPKITTTNGAGSDQIYTARAGTYDIIETIPIDWTFNFAICDKAFTPGTNGVTSVAVLHGQTTTCTFGNTKNGTPAQTSLKMIKTTTGGDANFDYNISPTPSTASVNTVSGIGSGELTTINPGTYDIIEEVQSDWIFNLVYCYTPGIGAIGNATANGVTGVTVSNGQTTTCTFGNTKHNPVPTITTISPASAIVGSTALTVTINGTNFVSSSAVQWNSSNIATTYMSATQVTATIPPANLTIAGTYNITMVNLSPGGGTSNAVSFTVSAVPRGTLKIIKTTTGGDGAFSYTVAGPTSLTPNITTVNGIGSSNTTVDTGIYSVIEKASSGWTFNFANCDDAASMPTTSGVTRVTIPVGQTVTCTFSNTKTGTLGEPGEGVRKGKSVGGNSYEKVAPRATENPPY